MDFIPQSILARINGDPERLGEAFGRRLTMKEDFMLSRLYAEITMRVDAILDQALSGGPEIILDQKQRAFVMEMTAFRRSIRKILRERGPFKQGRESLN